METSRRPAATLEAGKQFGSVSCASPARRPFRPEDENFCRPCTRGPARIQDLPPDFSQRNRHGSHAAPRAQRKKRGNTTRRQTRRVAPREVASFLQRPSLESLVPFCGHAHGAWQDQHGGGGWESNPPGTLLSPTLVLKTRTVTSTAYASNLAPSFALLCPNPPALAMPKMKDFARQIRPAKA